MKTRYRLLPLALLIALPLTVTATVVSAGKLELPPIGSVSFATPMDNPYLPMAIGQTYVYLSDTDEGVVRDEITNTTATVNILGVDCTVVHDIEWVYVEDLSAWKLLEETFDWIAWDDDGNVWYFGEDTTAYEYDDAWNPVGTSTEGSWTAGVDGAQPGILMLAAPAVGVSYLQEYYEGEAEDMAKVLRLNDTVELDAFPEPFEDVLVTKEWSPLDSGTVEHKHYAPGVGLVSIEELKEKTVRVELVLILGP